MKQQFDISFPKRVIFRSHGTKTVGTILQGYGFKHTVVLTDAGIKQSGICDSIVQNLKEAHLEVTLIDSLPREPANTDVDRIMQSIKATSCDNIVAVGGGSVLDIGKLSAVPNTYPFFSA
ncbi:MAG: iron-containing alcohol dehydrogenase [Sphaerochaetaceae bacterium]